MSTLSGPLAITAVEITCSLGDHAPQVFGAIRGDLNRFHEYEPYATQSRDPEWEDGEPAVVASIPGLDADLTTLDRIIAIAIATLADIPESGRLTRAEVPRVAVLASLPRVSEEIGRTFFERLATETGLAAPAGAEVVQSGHTGMFELLERADVHLSKGADKCILLGVDSFLALDRLADLDEAWRLKSERNRDGFIPGEGGVALLVEREATAAARGQPVGLVVDAMGYAREPHTFAADRNSSGAGLTDALRAVWGDDRGACRWVLCDMNGESYRAFEWGVAVTRHTGFGDVATLVHPADCVGDVGAASGGLLLGSATAAFSRDYAPDATAVLWTASDGQARAAVRVRGGKAG